MCELAAARVASERSSAPTEPASAWHRSTLRLASTSEQSLRPSASPRVSQTQTSRPRTIAFIILRNYVVELLGSVFLDLEHFLSK